MCAWAEEVEEVEEGQKAARGTQLNRGEGGRGNIIFYDVNCYYRV